MTDIPLLVENLRKNNFISEFKREVNDILGVKNSYTQKAGYPSFYDFIQKNSSQPKADFTKNLSVDMDIAFAIIMKKFNAENFDNSSCVGYDRVIDGQKVESKVSGTIDECCFNSRGYIRSNTWSGNHYQGQKDRCDYFQFLSYNVDTSTGLIREVWGMLLKNTDQFKEYYKGICEHAHASNTAQLSIKVPNTFKLNEDFWTLNCRASINTSPKGPRSKKIVTLEELLSESNPRSKKLDNWNLYPPQ